MGAEPEESAAVIFDMADHIVLEPLSRGDGCELISAQSIQSSSCRADPERAVRLRSQALHIVARKAFARGELLQRSVFAEPAQATARHAEPNGAIAGSLDCANVG